jgi:hypothetical protein
MTSIPLDDPRLVAIVTGSLDEQASPGEMQLPPRAGLSMRCDGDMALFKTCELVDGTPIEVAARKLSVVLGLEARAGRAGARGGVMA